MTENEIENRRHPRHEIPLEGTLRAGSVVVPCRVRNISAGGALIEIEHQLRVAHLVTIEIPEIGRMTARVARVSWKFTGLSLVDGEEAVDAFIVEWLERESKDTPSP
jgi:hypothetical protein